MVYISSWPKFQEEAEALYTKSPNKTRYCVKWRASEGKLVLKITDDTTCLKYKTHSSIFLNRFEALNYALMRKMQNLQPVPETQMQVDAPANSQANAPSSINRAGTPQATVGDAAISSAGPAGGVKKKKGKKKK